MLVFLKYKVFIYSTRVSKQDFILILAVICVMYSSMSAGVRICLTVMVSERRSLTTIAGFMGPSIRTGAFLCGLSHRKASAEGLCQPSIRSDPLGFHSVLFSPQEWPGLIYDLCYTKRTTALNQWFTQKCKELLKMYSPSGHQNVLEVASSFEQIRRNWSLRHLLNSGSSAVNGCHQNETRKLLIETSQ